MRIFNLDDQEMLEAPNENLPKDQEKPFEDQINVWLHDLWPQEDQGLCEELWLKSKNTTKP